MKRGGGAVDAEVAERLLTPEEVGELFQVSGRTVRDWFHAGKIPAEVAVGRIYRFSLRRVREALAADAQRVSGMVGVC